MEIAIRFRGKTGHDIFIKSSRSDIFVDYFPDKIRWDNGLNITHIFISLICDSDIFIFILYRPEDKINKGLIQAVFGNLWLIKRGSIKSIPEKVSLYGSLEPTTTAEATAPTISAAITATTPAAAEATTATTTFGAWASFVDVKGPSMKFIAVKAGDSRHRLFLVGHLDKAKAARFAAEFVLNDGNTADLTEALEGLAKIALFRLAGEIADVDIHSTLRFCLSLYGSFFQSDPVRRINRLWRTIALLSPD
jgi:hypothetical protein